MISSQVKEIESEIIDKEKLRKFYVAYEDEVFKRASEGFLSLVINVNKFNMSEKSEIFKHLLERKFKVIVNEDEITINWSLNV